MGADPITSAVTTLSTLRGRPCTAFSFAKKPKGTVPVDSWKGWSTSPRARPYVSSKIPPPPEARLIKAIQRAQDAGLRVVQCITVVDREEGAMQRLADEGWQLEALSTRSELLDR